jgi:ornithine decarboxylase
MIRAIDVRSPDGGICRSGQDFRSVDMLISSGSARTPLLILSRSAVRSNLANLAQALPGVAIHYAIKANNHPAILEETSRAGHNYDIASYQELQQAIKAGGKADRLIHSHPIKSSTEIENAVKAGVSRFVVDNPDEIDKFKHYADRVGLLIRFKVKDSAAVVNLSYKFGCEPAEVPGLARRMKKLGIKYHGLTFHVGSQCADSKVYTEAIDTGAGIINHLKSEGFKTELLDIGGGFPVPYLDSMPSIGEFCKPISRALERKIDRDIARACEPGRYISATAVSLAASVIGKSRRSGRYWYFLDDGLYGSFSGRLYDHCQYRVLTNRNTSWKRSVLAGPTCDSFDIIYKDIILPPLEIGDILLFPAMGAYCSVSASTFNCLGKAEYIVID